MHALLLRDPAARESLQASNAAVLGWHDTLLKQPFYVDGLRLFESRILPLLSVGRGRSPGASGRRP